MSAKKWRVAAAALALVVVAVVLWRFTASHSATANLFNPASAQSSPPAAAASSAPSTQQSTAASADRSIPGSAPVAATTAPTMPPTATSVTATAPSPAPIAEPATTPNRESGALSEPETLPAGTALADRNGPLHPRIDEVTATRRMVAAHAPLHDPKVADPDSAGNRQILQTMLSKAIIRRDTNAATATAKQGN